MPMCKACRGAGYYTGFRVVTKDVRKRPYTMPAIRLARAKCKSCNWGYVKYAS